MPPRLETYGALAGVGVGVGVDGDTDSQGHGEMIFRPWPPANSLGQTSHAMGLVVMPDSSG